MERNIDLHIHTSFSDGIYTPRQVVERALMKNLAAIAITDHDTTDGISESICWGGKNTLEVVPGIELSSDGLDSVGEEIHILGYYIDWDNSFFQDKLRLFRQARERRVRHILDKLYHLNLKLKEERLFEIAGMGSIGRLHIARLMVEEGHVKTSQEAFDKYLVYGKPAYVPRLRLAPEEAIQMIIRIGGIPVLAHPKYGANKKKIVKYLKGKGLMGIEVYYEKHTPHETETYLEWACTLDLLVTGGSDCHGSLEYGKEELMGSVDIKYKLLHDMKKAKKHLLKKNLSIFSQDLLDS